MHLASPAAVDIGHHPVDRVIEHHRLAVRLLDEQAQTGDGGDQDVHLRDVRKPGLIGGSDHRRPAAVHLGGAGQARKPQGLLHPAQVFRHRRLLVPHRQADIETVIRPEARAPLAGEKPVHHLR